MEKRPAPPVLEWFKTFFEQLAKNETDVPCGTCSACCRSFDRITLHPDEAENYEHVGLEDGSFSLKVDEDTGCCEYLDEQGHCTIYATRPLNCRQFDCRVLAYCGLEPTDYPLLAEAVDTWNIPDPNGGDAVLALALRISARHAVLSGASAIEAAGHAVIGGYKEHVDRAKELYKEELKRRKPKFVDPRGNPL